MRSLRINEEVLGRDGRRLGVVERLVVDERAHRVTHVVIRGRLVGVARLSDVDGARLTAELDRDELARQPEARAETVSSPGAHWRAPGGYSLDDFLAIVSALSVPVPAQREGDAEIWIAELGLVGELWRDDAGHATIFARGQSLDSLGELTGNKANQGELGGFGKRLAWRIGGLCLRMGAIRSFSRNRENGNFFVLGEIERRLFGRTKAIDAGDIRLR